MGKLAKWLLGLWMAASIVMSFSYAPEATRPNFGTLDAATGKPVMEAWPAFRIFYYHVPAAWIAVLAFGVAMIYGIRVLRRPEARLDDVAAASSELGLLFSALALVSGMMWARMEWGAFWNWDPRESSILILLLIYAGYFTLRTAVPDPLRRARLAAVYSIVAFVTVPFLVFLVPRIMQSLHPSPIINEGSRGGSMNPRMFQVFMMFLVGYTGLYAWILALRVRTTRLHRMVHSQ